MQLLDSLRGAAGAAVRAHTYALAADADAGANADRAADRSGVPSRHCATRRHLPTVSWVTRLCGAGGLRLDVCPDGLPFTHPVGRHPG